MSIRDLPTVNASLNTIATILLIWGRIAIAQGKRDLHKKIMCAALAVSSLFLTSYLIYHFNVEFVTKYQGEGFSRTFYFIVLFTHIPLATLMVPFILYAFYLGFQERFELHKKIVRWIWPVWLYVSFTGVIIYIMLYL